MSLNTAKAGPLPALALGPVSYYWPRDTLFDFYEKAASWPIEMVYLGEVVCAKRHALALDDWLNIADRLTDAGKIVYLSTMTLLEASSELGSLRRICRNGQYPVEANDLAAVYQLHKLGLPFVTGPAINIYNARTLDKLVSLGLHRWTLPVELGAHALREISSAAATKVKTEVFAWGRLPLAWSARCFTARAEQCSKDNCGFACLNDPDGRLMQTRDDVPFLALNGIQTQSALTHNLAPWMEEILELNVDVLRLSPQSQDMESVVGCFDRIRRAQRPKEADLEKLETLAPTGCCDGYWHGGAGFNHEQKEAAAQ